jgi:hypothetical protein
MPSSGGARLMPRSLATFQATVRLPLVHITTDCLRPVWPSGGLSMSGTAQPSDTSFGPTTSAA